MNILSLLKPKRFFSLLRADAKNIIRDPILVYVSVLAILPVVIIYFWGANIDDYFKMPGVTKLALPIILTISAFLVGWICGFLILEERDDGALLAIEITPIGKRGLMAYRLMLTFIISLIISFITLILLAPNMALEMRIFYGFIIGIEAVCVALIIPTFASNKVEGLAIAKLTNIGAIMPGLALIPSPWRYLAAIFPSFWVGESFDFVPLQYLNQTIIIIIAIILHILVFLLLFFLFNRKVG